VQRLRCHKLWELQAQIILFVMHALRGTAV
jgi:hypothetical protein